MTRLLEDKQKQLQDKETELSNIHVKLDQVNKQLLDQKQHFASEKHDLLAMLEHAEQSVTDAQEKQKEMLADFEEEKCRLQGAHTNAIDKMRDTVENLRNHLENEKQQLCDQIISKEGELVKLRADLEELRLSIQEMHKNHQARLTSLSNQMNRQHSDQMQQLRRDYENQLASLREQLPDKSHADLEEEKAALERKLQEVEAASTSLKKELEHQIQRLQEESTAQLQALKTSHAQEINGLQTSHQARVQALQDEHTSQMTALEDAHTQLIREHRTQAENMEQFKLDAEAQCRQKFDIQMAQAKSEYDASVQQLQEVNRRVFVKVADLRAKLSAVRAGVEHEYQHKLNKEREKEKKRLDAEFHRRLNEIQQRHVAAVNEQAKRAQRQVNEIQKKIAKDYEVKLNQLRQSHEASMQEVKDAAMASARLEAEQELKIKLEKQMKLLTSSHRQAEQQILEHHKRSVQQLEAEIQHRKDQHQALIETHKQELARLSDERKADVSVIKKEVETVLEELQAKELQRLENEHKSKIEELKREYILRRDRENETHQAELDALRKEIKKGNASDDVISKKDHEAVIQKLIEQHATDLSQFKIQESLRSELRASQDQTRRYEKEIKELKSKQSQRASNLGNTQANALAGLEQRGNIKAEMETIAEQLTKLQAMMSNNTEAGIASKVVAQAQKQLGAVQDIILQLSESEKTGLIDLHSPRQQREGNTREFQN
ncbi:hypothetical protein BX666DRAFT_181708 [Dichotomocladium elegans]|nr:hypothetical protein BX666DRAFT_181708 [Dichotomocladium elegans]